MNNGQWVDIMPAPPKIRGYSSIAYSEMSDPIEEPMITVFARSVFTLKRRSIIGRSSSTMNLR